MVCVLLSSIWYFSTTASVIVVIIITVFILCIRHVSKRAGSLLSQCGPWGTNSGHWAWQQVPYPPGHLADPMLLILLILVVALRFPSVELCHAVHCVFV